jgi:deoxyribodipyrimidine photo-lyase
VHSPAATPPDLRWSDGGLPDDGVPDDPDLGEVTLPAAGESAARERWESFKDGALHAYATGRNKPGVAGTSQLSVHLKYGTIHPRTLLAELPPGEGGEAVRREVVFRDFYADVLWHRPESARTELQPAMAALEYDEGPEADARFAAWAQGRTGFPIVDAGMRQLATEAWVHNRVRMVVASFFCKDLHLHWRRGARHFMQHLRDGDLASNQQGWQWVAGTGTDPSPYFRIFNPVTQGKQHDPDGAYLRRYLPELRDVEGPLVHEPWKLPGGPPNGYPLPIVDHAAERAESLRRYADVKR